MKINFTCKIVVISLYLFSLFCSVHIYAQTNVLTQHNNLDRTGWDSTETILNTKNVAVGSFGKLYTRPVDDEIYAQLLLMNNVNIPGKGNKNIVFAATVNNSVYAYDADSANVSTPYWQINLTPNGKRPVQNTDETSACSGNYRDFAGNMGIVGTPVIDAATKTMYVVARSCDSAGSAFVQYLHAIDISTGAERANSPVPITAAVAGTGSGAVGGTLTFNAQKQNQRCGLLLLNGIVYICYAAHCDWGPYHGWILGYDKTSLAQSIVYNTTPDGNNGGIWMSGGAPAADPSGNIYVSSGNGSAGYNGNYTDLRNRSESSLKLTPQASTLSVSSYFTPNNYLTLEATDLDFGVTQLMLIPGTNQAITACKDGHIYLVDRDNMGGYNAGSNNNLQTINLGTNAHLRSAFSYYKGSQKEFIYSWSENALLKAFPYSRTLDKIDEANTISSGVQGPVGNSGAFLSVSSNGSVDSTAVLWATFAASGDANQSVRPGILHAFDANDVTKELWNSSQNIGDDPGNYAKFNCPTIANGKVYLATFSNQFVVYGLTGNPIDTCNSLNIALNKPAFASSSENSTNTADKAFDGDPATRWGSVGQADPQYIYVDLGTKYDLCQVVLQWESALGKDFTIDVSDDAVNWTTLASKTNNFSLSNFISIKGSGRYVRMFGTARGTHFGYSLYSFEVYGTLSAGDCGVPDSLSISDIFENTTTLHWKSTGAGNYNIQYKAVTSPDWLTISSDTNMLVLNNLTCGTDYLFKVQSVCSATDTSVYSNSASFSQLACGSNCDPLPTRWTTQDIGNTDIPGSACYTPDIFTLNGSGDDIGNTADAFRFAQKTLAGDGQFDARVLSMDNSNVANKCGIMIRETLASGSKFVSIELTSGSGALFQSRSVTDGNATATTTAINIAPPYWVRLFKTGTVYSAQISPDGANYTTVGSPVNAGFGSNPVYAGLAITSHNNAVLSTAQVDKYVFTSGVLPLTLLSFDAALNLNHKVDLTWATTLETKTNYFVIERSNSDHDFVAIDSIKAMDNGSFATTYDATDDSPMSGLNFYRLKIIDNDGQVTYSALAMVRVNDSKAPVLYPNPAKTIVHIVQGTDPIKHVSVYDISGKALRKLTGPFAGNTIEVPTSDLMRGTYIVEITTSSNIYRDKLLIQ